VSDTVATFWIITEQGQVFSLGDANPSREFGFRLTEKNYNSWAYITLMARNVDFQNNRVTLNGHTVGNLDPTPGGAWSQQTLIVEVYGTQKFGDSPNNRVKIEARNSSGGTSGNLDDFEVKHLVFHYRTNR
jgi:hypothetical protein